MIFFLLTSFDNIVNKKKEENWTKKTPGLWAYCIKYYSRKKKTNKKLLLLVDYTIIFVGYIHFPKDNKITKVIMKYETLL